ncbi:hypothetical protein [Erwinia pyrifoliae]|uniref:Uncharacterized protein n=1 Tax=Erwinia pyrifoliae TaxID=79967 RepID=A0ABY5X9L1_ERWPY|nr:hypothetical protein [Erwinia pyrifoliae]AUX73938.1 hypothetical protein CPI84_16630 [Erwinia pyrifoliae]MCA8875726.1 hypothetical protein [Erwinia pyrifoliae]UWS34079.1 hypothetical protein NYP84_02400 [Erwinia pyrifoliae]UXK11907.1 hypothetical protein NYP80_16715 [Erwinia pyrifoliae]CAX54216.1 uncharacterized protein EpC_04580 [Erwinia pyrifoliae Ep1/96]
MSEDGFKTDDLSSTIARFASKRRNIIQDKSRLERKIQDPVTLPSATHDCGAVILTGLASILTPKQRERNEENEEWRKRWEAEREQWVEQDREWQNNR